MISPADLEKYESLIDPEREQQPTFNWGEDYQRIVLSTLLADRVFLLQSIDLIQPSYFTNLAHRRVCEILFDHFRTWRTIPTQSILRKEIEKSPNADLRLFYLAELQNLIDVYEPGVESREYLEREITTFAKMQSLKKAMSRALKEISYGRPESEETWEKIHGWFKDAMVVDLRFDPGLDYFGGILDRFEKMKAERQGAEVFTTGLKPIDDSMGFGGLRRGEILCYTGPPGSGKSLLLVKCAVDNVKRGKKVLYISLEMSETDIATRIDAQLADVNIREIIENEHYIVREVKHFVENEEDKRKLMIKQFPSGTADVNTIKAYLLQLQMTGWKPDLLIVDYVGEMKDHAGIPIYESREKIVRDLRGMGIELDHCTVSALQPNRSGRDVIQEGSVISDNNLGDSYGQVRSLDFLVSINQTNQEHACNLARIHVAKARAGRSKFTFPVDINPMTLAFNPISDQRYRVRLSEAIDKVTVEDKLGAIIGKKNGYERG